MGAYTVEEPLDEIPRASKAPRAPVWTVEEPMGDGPIYTVEEPSPSYLEDFTGIKPETLRSPPPIGESFKETLPKFSRDQNAFEVTENIAKTAALPISAPLAIGSSLIQKIPGVTKALDIAGRGASGATKAAFGDIQGGSKAVKEGRPFSKSVQEAMDRFTVGDPNFNVEEYKNPSVFTQFMVRLPGEVAGAFAEFLDPANLPTVAAATGVAHVPSVAKKLPNVAARALLGEATKMAETKMRNAGYDEATIKEFKGRVELAKKGDDLSVKEAYKVLKQAQEGDVKPPKRPMLEERKVESPPMEPPAPSAITPADLPSPELVQATAKLVGPDAPFMVPGLGQQSGVERMTMTAKKLGEAFSVTSGSIMEAMKDASRAMAETGSEQAAYAAFWARIPIRNALQSLDIMRNDPQAADILLEQIKSGDPEIAKSLMSKIMEEYPALAEIHPEFQIDQAVSDLVANAPDPIPALPPEAALAPEAPPQSAEKASGVPGPGGVNLPETEFVKMAKEKGIPEDLIMKELYSDELTSAWNRKYAVQKKLIHRPNIHFDLDFFKKVNDTHGHAVGDRVLKAVVGVARKHGFEISRLGGEEFQVYPKLGENPIDFVNRFRAFQNDLANVEIESEGKQLLSGIQLSAGFGQNMDAADAVSYRAKRGGRDRIILDKSEFEAYNLSEGTKHEWPGTEDTYNFQRGVEAPLPQQGEGADSSISERRTHLRTGNRPAAETPELTPPQPVQETPAPVKAPSSRAPKSKIPYTPLLDQIIPKPEAARGYPDVVKFVKQNGGINPDKGDSSGILELERPDLVNRRAGKSLDGMREAMAEAGYLQRGGNPHEVLDLLDTQIKTGKKQYPIDVAGEIGEARPIETLSPKDVQEAIDDLGQIASQRALSKTEKEILSELIDFKKRTQAHEAEPPTEWTVEEPPGGGYESGMAETGAKYGDQTKTPAFKNWFGESKVVDEKGNPLVVYHGTKYKFSTAGKFDLSNLGKFSKAPSAREGFFFTNNSEVASGYSTAGDSESVEKLKEKADILEKEAQRKDRLSGPGMGGDWDAYQTAYLKYEKAALNPDNYNVGAKVFPVYLSLKNPLIHDYAGSVYREESYFNLIREAKENGKDGVIFKNTYDAVGGYGQQIGSPHDIYVVFEPIQIKSAVGNDGTFDPKNPNILKEPTPKFGQAPQEQFGFEGMPKPELPGQALQPKKAQVPQDDLLAALEKAKEIQGELPMESELMKPMSEPEPTPSLLAGGNVTTALAESGNLQFTSLTYEGPITAVDALYHLKNETVENIYFILVDKAGKIIGVDHNAIGQPNHADVNLRRVLEIAKKANAAKIIPVHNHPSGKVVASRDDISMTVLLKKVGKEFGIEVGDHVIIDHGEYGLIGEDNTPSVHKFVEPKERPFKVRILKLAQERKSPGIYQGKSVTNSMQAVDVMKELLDKNKNTVFAMILNNQLEINAVTALGTGTDFGTEIIKPLVDAVVNHAGVRIVLTANDELSKGLLAMISEKLKPLSASLADMIFPDATYSDYTSMAETNPEYFPRVSEDTPAFEAREKNERNALIQEIKSAVALKALSNATVSRMRKSFNVEAMKTAPVVLLKELRDFIQTLEVGDRFISDKQLSALKDILARLERPDITPKRTIIQDFGEKSEIMSDGIMGKIANELIPTVDIKEGHPLVAKIVNQAELRLDQAIQEVSRRDENFEKMISKAEESRKGKLSPIERLRRRVAPQNKEIFQALGGEKVDLTKEEAAVVAYLRNFFEKARKDLELDKYRKNYVTHMDKPFMEKMLTDGIVEAAASLFKSDKPLNIPVNVMLELDNIIGGTKFFKYALERKGYGAPTTNLRRIVHGYSQLYETKMALDAILPEGQAVVQLLLQPRSAQWAKRFLQNLKGRGLDHDFRTGKMAWLPRLADQIISLGYLKLLGLGWRTALKNVIAGESNSFIYQDLMPYLRGKQRFIMHPTKAYKMAQVYGILEGTYTDYAQQGLDKIKKLGNALMFMQRAGEVEIRVSLMLGELTDREWDAVVSAKKDADIVGHLMPERVRKIKDMIAVTQGIFSKAESPLFLQTWYGRVLFQMNRWRITNAMFARRAAKSAKEEWFRGEKGGHGTRMFLKMLLLYGLRLYLAYELGKAGLKQGQQYAKALGETIGSITDLFTSDQIIQMFTDNPTYSIFKELWFTIQELMAYIGVAEKPKKVKFQRGIEDTLVRPVRTIQEILGIDTKKKKRSKNPMGGSLSKSLSPSLK